MSTLDSSWVMSAGYNGLVAHNSPAWLALYLAVCKLLDLALALPAQSLPQFQMYKWAFVSEGNDYVDPRQTNAGHASAAGAPAASGGASGSAGGTGEAPVNGGVGLPSLPFVALPQQDFVPYVVRVAKLLIQKVILVMERLRSAWF